MAKIYDAEMQYLNVAYAKDIGLTADGDARAFASDQISRSAAGLRPLLIYSVTVPCYGLKARLLVDASAPISISSFLALAWAPDRALGMPQRLEMEEVVLKSDKGFVSWAQAQGVVCEPASSVKALRAFARSAQDLWHAISWGRDDWRNPEVEDSDELDDEYEAQEAEIEEAEALSTVNLRLHEYDRFQMEFFQIRNSSMEHVTFKAWCSRGASFCTGTGSANDWASTCVVDVPRRISPHRPAQADPDDGWEPYVYGIKEIVSLWPGGRRAFFRGLKCTARDLDDWAASRIELPYGMAAELLMKACPGVDLDQEPPDLSGGQLLIAAKPRAVDEAYTALSKGGDLDYSFEILAPPGRELLMRVLVFAACGDRTTLILFPRDAGPLEALLDKQRLINMGSARQAPDAMWDLLAFIVEKRERFINPAFIGYEFGRRNSQWLEEGMHQWGWR